MILLNHDDVLARLPDRDPWGHKGNFGKLLLLCGSRGYTGAAYFAAMGALRTGAGLVYLGVPEEVYPIVAGKLNEPVILPLPQEAGVVSQTAVAQLLPRLPQMDAIVLGPGLGTTPGALAVMTQVLKNAACPVVLDADGITMAAAHKDLLRGRTGTTILTPHDGEFARLGGDLRGDRGAAADALARELGCIVLRKGHETHITDGTTHYLNCTGNPGMATGGSGDILAGMIGSLLGQGIPALEAAACAAWIHGRAGDLTARELGEYGMLPTDLLDRIPRLLK